MTFVCLCRFTTTMMIIPAIVLSSEMVQCSKSSQIREEDDAMRDYWLWYGGVKPRRCTPHQSCCCCWSEADDAGWLAGKSNAAKRGGRDDVPRWATNVNLYASVHAMRCEIVIQLMVLLHDSCRVESSRFNSNIAILNPSTHFTTIHRPFAKIITAPELNSVPDKV